jgi:hypothetical protein
VALLIAEDAVQESLVRAWRGVGGLDDEGSSGRGSTRSRPTGASLRLINVAGALPVDLTPGTPTTEINWLGPYPDILPEAHYPRPRERRAHVRRSVCP